MVQNKDLNDAHFLLEIKLPWSNILKKSFGVQTTQLIKYVCLFWKIMHESVNPLRQINKCLNHELLFKQSFL